VSGGEFDDFLKSLSRLGGTPKPDPVAAKRISETAIVLQQLPQVSRSELTRLLHEDPEHLATLALSVRLSGEQLKNIVSHRFGTGVRQAAKKHPKELVDLLDQDFDLTNEIRAQRSRDWTFGDILAERAGARLRAGGAIRRGRDLEDAVQKIATNLKLPIVMRTRFTGRRDQTAPADMAIPEGGTGALIVVGIKGFDATGSKLTDAFREIESMADVRRPDQYVYVVVDGIGWVNRRSDLRRIVELRLSNAIDGLYNLKSLGRFEQDLSRAARRVGLLN
jgi:hypothetical protein